MVHQPSHDDDGGSNWEVWMLALFNLGNAAPDHRERRVHSGGGRVGDVGDGGRSVGCDVLGGHVGIVIVLLAVEKTTLMCMAACRGQQREKGSET